MTFIQQALLQVIGALALAIFSFLVGKKTIVEHRPYSSKWRWLIIIATIVMWYGVLLFLGHVSTGGFQDPYTGLGITLAVFGKITQWIGKVFK